MFGWGGADMAWALFLLATMLLPLFPLSWVFNRLVTSLPGGWAQAVAVVVLPQLGLEILRFSPTPESLPPSWRLYGSVWAVVSALLYAFRALTAREVGIWTRLLVSSGLALVWLDWWSGTSVASVQLFALSWSLPAALLLLLAAALTRRLGGAYLGLQGGLVAVLPRLSASLTLSALALLGTPLFPTFFALLGGFGRLPLAWVPLLMPLPLLWGWATGRFFQDLLYGDFRGEPMADLGRGPAFLIGLALLTSLFLSLFGGGVWL